MKAYDDLKSSIKTDNNDEQKGVNAVLESIKTPLYQISENAGFDGSEIVSTQLTNLELGFDAKEGKWVNMLEEGIVDPTKVTRLALLNAASISALFLTTEGAVASIPEPEKATPEMPMY